MSGVRIRKYAPVAAQDWEDAACLSHVDPDLWFAGNGSGKSVQELEAKRICKQVCPLRERCLDWAMRNEIGQERWGIYGGLSPHERRKLARRLARRRSA